MGWGGVGWGGVGWGGVGWGGVGWEWEGCGVGGRLFHTHVPASAFGFGCLPFRCLRLLPIQFDPFDSLISIPFRGGPGAPPIALARVMLPSHTEHTHARACRLRDDVQRSGLHHLPPGAAPRRAGGCLHQRVPGVRVHPHTQHLRGGVGRGRGRLGSGLTWWGRAKASTGILGAEACLWPLTFTSALHLSWEGWGARRPQLLRACLGVHPCEQLVC